MGYSFISFVLNGTEPGQAGPKHQCAKRKGRGFASDITGAILESQKVSACSERAPLLLCAKETVLKMSARSGSERGSVASLPERPGDGISYDTGYRYVWLGSFAEKTSSHGDSTMVPLCGECGAEAYQAFNQATGRCPQCGHKGWMGPLRDETRRGEARPSEEVVQRATLPFCAPPSYFQTLKMRFPNMV
ncbi:hypothetical protein XENTR_v10023971 [Xenopus tropicalis]|nr:hypothetical protein XENTR_v10023971 [Xenopus tropicalis]